ncbi:uncharacterized protein LOC134076676 isoform X2 [Sardina pilchardus]|uniref:uncharacterized protein LOC134076676 isoform X2 n=1 Tax=Sardina pilchardus TaxID=27697 RepID=UPI002E10DAEF
MGSQDHSPGNTTKNPDTDDNSSQPNRTSGLPPSLKTSSLRNNIGPRPDWLLYTFPGLAFVIGIVLFLLVLKTHKKRTGGYYHRDMKGCSSVKQIKNDAMGDAYLTKADTQSYENVLAPIYGNQEGVCFFVQEEDDDYVNPDEDDAAEMLAQNQDCLNLPDTLTEGESYENMEGLYAQPRKRQTSGQEEDDDYLDPDAEEQQWQGGHSPLEQTDTDSYENMDQHIPAHQEDSDESSYVSTEDNLMAPIEDEEWD